MVTRLSGGITPADGSDPRTFPSIWNATADTIESQGTAITTAESDIDDLEAKNIPAFGTATPSDGQVLTYSTAISAYEPAAGGGGGDLDSLSDVSIGTAVSDGDLLAYDSGTSEWVNQALESAQLPAGSVLQVVQATQTTEVVVSSTSYADTGLSAIITPTSSSSKILVLVSHIGYAIENNLGGRFYAISVDRGATLIAENAQRALARGSTTDEYFPMSWNFSYLDSPATTSATTYKTRAKVESGASFYINNSGFVGDGIGTITLMEIAG